MYCYFYDSKTYCAPGTANVVILKLLSFGFAKTIAFARIRSSENDCLLGVLTNRFISFHTE